MVRSRIKYLYLDLMNRIYYIFILLLSFFVTSCLGPVSELYPENKEQRPVQVHVVNLGWHTAIAFEGEYLRKKLPDHKEMPGSRFLMMGWGDAKYYPAERTGIGLLLRAAFWPTGSVLHLVGFDDDVEIYFSGTDVVELHLSEDGMEEMITYISERFQRDGEGKLEYAEPGLYRNSAFFKAKELYFFPRTSNKWTARVLRKSGYPITPFYAITADNVMRQVSKH